jgi:alpha-acetolactate decarboxylase
VTADQLVVQMHQVSDLHVALPETVEFLEADLNGDNSAALDVTEHRVDPRRT